jgi:hypothetical protein
MSIEQTDVIDIVSTERTTGQVTLSISGASDAASEQTQSLSGLRREWEILERYPHAKDSRIEFRVVFKFPPDEAGRAFLARVKPIVELAGFTLRDEVFTGALLS